MTSTPSNNPEPDNAPQPNEPPESDAVDEPDGRGRGPTGITLVAFVVALMFLAGVIGWRIGSDTEERPGQSSVDAGFFQDMSTHHTQVISMGFTYLTHGTDPLLRQIASEIITYQSADLGVMGDYLNEWGRAGTQTDTAMRWMGMATPRDQMPGLATPPELRALAAARGTRLDDLFTQLVIEHHAGGIHMAQFARRDADTDAVQRWAKSMVDGQRDEISELNRWRVRSGLSAVPVDLRA